MKKRVWLTITAVLLAIGIGCGTFFGVNAIGKNMYWNAAPLSDVEAIGGYTRAMIEERQTEHDLGEATCVEFLQRENVAQPLPAAALPSVDQGNALLTRYFKENYSIDVASRLEKLQVRMADFSSDPAQAGVAGYYNNYADDGVVYLLTSVVETAPYELNEFLLTYVHEALHYLGTAQDGSGSMILLYEGITEYLTHEVLHYGGRCPEDNCLEGSGVYRDFTDTAAEILKQTPDLVPNVIAGEGKYDLEEALNTAFDGRDYADRLNAALYDLSAGVKGAAFTAQLLTNEYVKATGGERNDLSLTPAYGWQWLFF